MPSGKDLPLITVKAGELFSVDFRATPATGYQWSAAGVPAGIELLSDAFELDEHSSSPTPIPAPGTRRFHFLAVRPGRVELLFVLKRSWESEPVEQRIEVVDVTP